MTVTGPVYVVKTLAGVTQDKPLRPAGYRILVALWRVAQRLTHDITITCLTGGHKDNPNDPHNLGCAVDIRTNDLTASQQASLYFFLMEELGPLFYVQLEAKSYDDFPGVARQNIHLNPAATGPHCHIQLAQGHQYPPSTSE